VALLDNEPGVMRQLRDRAVQHLGDGPSPSFVHDPRPIPDGDQGFGFAGRDLRDQQFVVAFVVAFCLQAVDELRCVFESMAGFFRPSEVPPCSDCELKVRRASGRCFPRRGPGTRGGEQSLVGGGIVAAAVFGHAEGHQGPLASIELRPHATEYLRPSVSALSVDGRILSSSGVHSSELPGSLKK
jgi:hypothetical protein